jgi:LmbE family N-acetylglucosaminyl deacetylase
MTKIHHWPNRVHQPDHRGCGTIALKLLVDYPIAKFAMQKQQVSRGCPVTMLTH